MSDHPDPSSDVAELTGPKLTRNQKRYLSHFECGWCDHPLDKDGCSAIGDPCDEQTRIDRRNRCLEGYKPRSRKAK